MDLRFKTKHPENVIQPHLGA